MKVTYISDLHLEHGENVRLSDGDVLILAGDIGHPFEQYLEDFLIYTKTKFKYVFYVAGNHEYYGMRIDEANQQLSSLCNRCGVIFLNNTYYRMYIPDSLPVYFIGTTLWSYIPEEHENEMFEYLNDFRMIVNWTPKIHNQTFNKNYVWLKDRVDYCSKLGKVVVITHHAPLIVGTSNPEYEKEITTCGFASDCSEIINRVDKWIFGHTHFNTNINDTVISNQKGYGKGIRGWNPDKHFYI